MTSAARDEVQLGADLTPSAQLVALLDGDASVRLDPARAYCAAVSVAIPHRVDQGPVWWAQAEHGGLHWVLTAVEATGLLDQHLPSGAVGIGLPRLGTAGALRSLVDAREALALAVPRNAAVRWADDWVAATLVARGPELDLPCQAAHEVAARSPHLAEAVLAFAERGLSVVGAARSLHVHANTVIYRLERWRQLTGWDARTFPGLSLSVAALTRAHVRP